MIFTFTPSRHSMIISRDLNHAFSRRRSEMGELEKLGENGIFKLDLCLQIGTYIQNAISKLKTVSISLQLVLAKEAPPNSNLQQSTVNPTTNKCSATIIQLTNSFESLKAKRNSIRATLIHLNIHNFMLDSHSGSNIHLAPPRNKETNSTETFKFRANPLEVPQQQICQPSGKNNINNILSI